MFSSKCNYAKLKTNLRLSINRLKLLEKKKTELALKARKEIADYIQAGKEDRARIRVEHIVREDYMVEGLEILEMFCDLLLARFGIIERVSEVDSTIEEAIASIVWAEPRLSADIPELTVISKNLYARYGKEYHAACKANTLNNVNEKLIHKMSIYSPPKVLIENYMVEIAKSFNVEFSPDPLVLMGEEGGLATADLLNFGDSKPGSGPPPPPNVPPSGGSGGYPPPGGPGGNYPSQAPYPSHDPAYPPGGPVDSYPPGPPPQNRQPPGGFSYTGPPPNNATPFNYPPPNRPAVDPSSPEEPPSYTEKVNPDDLPRYSSMGGANNSSVTPPPPVAVPPPAVAPGENDVPSFPEIPGDDFNLPSVPGSTNPGAGGPGNPSNSNDIDFDDLAARFENLKKRK